MTSEELFKQSSRPMNNRTPIILQSKSLELLETKSLTQEQAIGFIGSIHPEGTIVGMTPKPGLQYPDGIYLTISNIDQPSKHIRVG